MSDLALGILTGSAAAILVALLAFELAWRSGVRQAKKEQKTREAEVVRLKNNQPKEEIEMEEQFGFGKAIKILKNGGAVCREGWNGKGMYLKLQTPDANSKMTLPYIYMHTVQRDLVPWLASQTDVLSEDWCEVEFKDDE